MTLAEEEDVVRSLQHIKDHSSKDGNNPFFITKLGKGCIVNYSKRNSSWTLKYYG